MLNIPNSSPISLEEAQRLVLGAVDHLPVIRLPLANAYGYCLAETIIADHDVPMVDRSSMDGYALRANDVNTACPEKPVKLHSIEEIPAGYVPRQKIAPGTASRIMTGGLIPEGADAVVKVEQTRREGEDSPEVWIYQSVTAGDSITRKGADMVKGTALLHRGTTIGPIEMGLLATFGIAEVSVFSKPKVGILSTGSELLDVNQPLIPGKQRDSNGAMLAGQVNHIGGNAVFLGIVQDHLEDLQRRILESLQQVDILVTSGGVSMGDYDFLGRAFEAIGAKVVFWKALIRPGMPILFGTWQGKPIFALPGNPASSYLNAWLFLLPAIRKMSGWSDPLPARLTVVNDENIDSKPILHTRFLRGLTYVSPSGELRVKISSKQSSSVLSSFLESNCFVRVPGGVGYASEELVEVELFGAIR